MDDFDERQDMAFSHGGQSVELRVLNKCRKGERLYRFLLGKRVPLGSRALAAREYLGVCWVYLNGNVKLITAGYVQACNKFEELKSRITKE